MSASTIQFITKTRLAELSRQREALLVQYYTAEAAGRGDDLASLARLFEGLKNVRISEIPLHQELPNLNALFHATSAPQSMVDFYRAKLMTELQRGRLRANLVYMFGAVLSEWDEADHQGAGRIQERRTEKDRNLAELCAPATEPRLELLTDSLSSLVNNHEQVQRSIADRLAKSLDMQFGLYYGLELISNNAHHPQPVRLEAKRFQKDHALTSQLNNAIRVVTRDPRQWSWPSDGVEPRILWTRHRWRLYPTLTLVELLCAHHTAEFWSSSIDQCYTNSAVLINRRKRLQKLIDLEAPEVIMANERRMLQMEKDRALFDWYEPVDPWTDQAILSEDDAQPVGGVFGTRAGRQAELREASSLGYGYDEGVNPMIQLVYAEIELLRAAYPDKPLQVLKLDVRDFFASVPHASLLTLLQSVGMTDDGIEFTRRYLQVPFKTDSQTGARTGSSSVATAARGVLMELAYSHWLCELLMKAMERFIHSQAKVRIIRQVDDLCLLSPSEEGIVTGYQAAQRFLADVGLSLNENKCGSVTIGGPRPVGLPQSSPRWGVLELTEAGKWQPNQAAFEEYLLASRNEVNARHAILSKVLAYNDQLKHLVWGLGLAMDLGDPHRELANKCLLAFENDFFGAGQSIFAGLRSLLEERHRAQVHDVPLAWMLWPITAGGLGVRSATVLCGQYQLAYVARCGQRKSAPSKRSENWQFKSKQWNAYYDDACAKLEPANCAESPTMKTLVERFIRRGQSISDGEQSGLSPYWRWTLSIFGPEILDRLGTFEFLLTELVPLQLIHDKLLGADSPSTATEST